MGEKETASAEETELLKNKTKSNQSNDRSAQEAGIVPGNEAALVKTKTKSNQSNDRLNQGDNGALDPDSDGDASGDDSAGAESRWYNVKTNEKGRLAAEGGSADDEAGVAAGDLDGDGPPEAAINNTKSNLKSGPGHAASDASAGGGAAGAKLAPEKPVKSEIAIGDPGVNDNLGVDDGGGSPDSVGLRTPRAGYDIKANTK